MQRSVGFRSCLALLALLVLPVVSPAQTPPQDFRFTATVGGRGPWSEQRTITIDSSAHGTYTRIRDSLGTAVIAETTFSISPAGLQRLWQSLQTNSFASLNAEYEDSTFSDGPVALLSVRANAADRHVTLRSAAQVQVQAILDSLNGLLPPSLRLRYAPPARGTVIPKDPCPPGAENLGRTLHRTEGNPFAGKEATRTVRARVAAPHGYELVHPGTVVAYEIPFAELVKQGRISLTSKGEFFGDAVSITIDNTQPPPPKATITIKLYIEFWGQYATPENVFPVIADILSKWNGVMTTGGNPLKIDVDPIMRPDALVPPGTPGYHQIELVPKDAVRSYVAGMGPEFGINYGTGRGQWELEQPPGIYAHEAGHLLGLEDQYDDFERQSNGSWYSKTANTYLSDDVAMAKYWLKQDPNRDYASTLQKVQKSNLVSPPKDDHAGDLMASNWRNPLQEDIDNIAAQAGLLVRIPDGTPLVSRNNAYQNLVVTHGAEIFVPAGQTRTLNGLYAACIDHGQLPPDAGTIFDVAPPLSSWSGIPGAASLAALAHFIDSSGLYCGDHPAAQLAVWRVTDDVYPMMENETDVVLLGAGVTAGDRVFDFPRLTSPSQGNTAAKIVVPDELFPADLRPGRIQGHTGKASAFHGSVARPAVPGISTSFQWFAVGPSYAPKNVVVQGDSALLTPDGPGVFELGLRVTTNDSATGTRSFTPSQRAVVVVPDSATETFEHGGLLDRYRWATSPDAPWKVSAAQAHTGNSSAESGSPLRTGSGPLSSSLEIRLSWPRDTTVTFALRFVPGSFTDNLEFLIDSVADEHISSFQDWQIFRSRIDAGERTLTWRTTSYGTRPAKAWLDNVFLPAGSVVTSTRVNDQVPQVYALEQNYPNPFNPKTNIGFRIAEFGLVWLAVYDLLGREVAVLVNEPKAPGSYEVELNASGLASGVYVYRLTAGAFVATRKMIVVK